MRKKFIQCENRQQAGEECPWAAIIVSVDGGYMCFESYDDYEVWECQNDSSWGE
jgi:hypothetical protein